ncbi:MAG: transcriptional regulator GcvA [Rhodospirillales bacterium]
MARRLPPLNGLRAFEAAARHLSFTRAAEELNVTQAAISHQIRGLEEQLDTTLFKRVGRGLQLSEAGQTLFPAIRDGLDAMAAGVQRIARDDEQGALTLTTFASIASAWLVQRLGGFRRQHPEIDVRLTLGDRLVDFRTEDVDLAIRYGRGKWDGTEAVFLMSEEIYPVISPDLLASGPPLVEPADLLRYRDAYPLLHDVMPEDWSMWFESVGIRNADINHGYEIEYSHLIAQAAMAGEGVALGRSVLVGDALASGRLVRLFDHALPAEFGYWLVAPPQTWRRPKVRAFRDWILEECARTGHALLPRAGDERGHGPSPRYTEHIRRLGETYRDR